MSTNKSIMQLADLIVKELGGLDNIDKANNCMTRVRVDVLDRSKVNVEALKTIDGVMGVVSDEGNYVQVVVGPGKARDTADYFGIR